MGLMKMHQDQYEGHGSPVPAQGGNTVPWRDTTQTGPKHRFSQFGNVIEMGKCS